MFNIYPILPDQAKHMVFLIIYSLVEPMGLNFSSLV
jgi:hypothetical protein